MFSLLEHLKRMVQDTQQKKRFSKDIKKFKFDKSYMANVVYQHYVETPRDF